MRLAHKLSLLLAAASAGPLLLASSVTLPGSARELRRQLHELYATSAEGLAEEIHGVLQEKATALELYSKVLGLDEFGDPRGRDRLPLEQAMRLVYSQTKSAGVVALFDSEGNAIITPVFEPKPKERGLSFQEAADEEALAEFARQVPFKEALAHGRSVVGPVYSRQDDQEQAMPRVVIAAPTLAPRGATWVIAVEVSLRPVVERLSRFRLGQSGRAALVDAAGGTLWEDTPAAQGEPLGAAALVKEVGWKVKVEQSTEEALHPIRRQYRAAVLWAAVGLLGAVLLGFTAVRTVTRPLERLERAVSDIEAGNLEGRVEVRGNDEIALLGEAFNTMVRGLKERERLRQSFSRYLSGEVAARILRENSDFEVKGEQVEVTILFVDIRGFTPIAERLAPREVVDLLNSYFERVVGVVMKYDGVVVKFIGDAVMAMFGVPREIPEPERRAVSAALEIQSVVEAYNAQRAAEGQQAARFGIGVNSGVAIAGNIGSSQRLEYTVIGDAVNLAERLQAQAAGGEVVVSASTYERVRAAFRAESRGKVKVKGKEQPVEIFRVLGAAEAKAARPGK
ncbi:MAG: HAMP domain-containing protein [Myxococcales bacterium]|nr:HAMP domain-containing protein [Myxococcales bacterium]